MQTKILHSIRITSNFDITEKEGSYEIKITAKDNPLIDETIMENINDGIDLYVEYLKSGVAQNLDSVSKMNGQIFIESVGGCAYRTLSRVLEKLEISNKYLWNNIEEDPFFHSIGKYNTDPKGNKVFYDYSVDATVIAKKPNGEKYFPVIESMHYEEKLKFLPLGTVVLITDPDHDRLTVCQIEAVGNMPNLEELGISYIHLGE